jgi:hypothetical protein
MKVSKTFVYSIIGLSIIGFLLLRPAFSKARIGDSTYAYTRNEAQKIATTISAYEEISSNEIPAATLTNAASLYANLTHAWGKQNLNLLGSNDRWDKTGRLVDLWNRDYVIEVAKHTNLFGRVTIQLAVWSHGSNKGYCGFTNELRNWTSTETIRHGD